MRSAMRPIRARTSGVTGPRALPPSLAAARRAGAGALPPGAARGVRALVLAAAAALFVFAFTRRSDQNDSAISAATDEPAGATYEPWLHHGHSHAHAHAHDDVRHGHLHADEAEEEWHPSSVETLQCPSFSGPGWRRGAFPTRATVVATEALVVTPEASLPPTLGRLRGGATARVPLAALPLAAVRLTPGASPFADAEAVNLAYINSLDVDRLVFSFRALARVPTAGAQPYGGWEDPGSELRGHFVGHYMSAAAAAFAATGDATVKKQLDDVVAALVACQSADGYLSAFPTELLERYESQTPVWAPYYTLHKILQGLFDAHVHAGSGAALAAALRLARYIGARAAAGVASKGIAFWRECLHAEYGGIPEALRLIGDAAGDRSLEAAARLWDKPCFHGPLAAGGDSLTGLHANTHLPLGPAAAARYAATGEPAFRAAAAALFSLVNTTRSFATGGSSHGELWHAPRELGPLVGPPHEGGTHSAESCATHNALKLAAWLLRVTPDVRYADFIERATLNGILGTLRGREPGRFLYMYPMGTGVSKAGRSQWRESGWSSPTEHFWCCVGTMVESFARLGESIYFEQPAARRLYVMHFVASTARWGAARATLTQRGDTPSWTTPGVNATLLVEFRVDPFPAAQPEGAAGASGVDGAAAVAASASASSATPRASLIVRIPAWASGAGLSATLNGVPLPRDTASGPTPGEFLVVRRAWRAGDTLALRLPLGAGLRAERIADEREPFRRLHALLYGPLVLAALTEGPRALAAAGPTASQLAAASAPVPADARAAMTSLRGCAGNGSPGAGLLLAHGHNGGFDTRLVSTPSEMPGPASRRAGGTDEHAAATWRVLALRSGVVALEASHRPGAFLCADGATAVLRVAEEDSGDVLAPRVPACAEWTPHALPAPQGATAYESVAARGAFLRAALGGALAVTAGGGGESDADACFAHERPMATLPAVAFWARAATPPGRRFLLLPLSDIIDEQYSAYVELQAAE
jgi:hypothetical protein